MDDDPLQQAPVVLVVVTRGADPDLDVVLRGVVAQDHRRINLVVLGVDAPDDLPARVGRIAPGAVVRSLRDGAWYAGAADEVLRLVEGDPAFFCFVRDGVVLAPTAVSALVREAYRSNAGVAGPKLVLWDQPERLASTGYAADKFGELAPYATVGELDQEQHDGVRDVFALDGACLLVRGDLFRRMDGFDPSLPLAGEDLDLCWRAHVAGARVLVVPDAVARWRVPESSPAEQSAREHNRMRSLLGNYSGSHLVRVVPQLAVVTVLEVVANLLRGRVRRAGALVAAWTGAVGGLGAIATKRRQVAELRVVGDAEVRRFQLRGSAALLRQLRRFGSDGGGRFVGVRTAGRQMATGVRRAERSSLAALAVLVVLTLVGGRSLVRHGVPVVGELVPLGRGAGDLLRAYTSGWSEVGVGRSAPVPPGFAVLGLAGVVVAGKLALLRTLLVVGALLVGGWGAWRLARPFRSVTARVAGLVVYAGLPVGVNAVAGARLGGLLVWAATPWAAARIVRLAEQTPFVTRNGRLTGAAGLALIVAVTSALAPAFVLVPVLVAAALVVGSVIAGGLPASARAAALALGATAVGALLLLPWPLVSRTRLGWGFGSAAASGPLHLSIGDLARFATGPHGRLPFALGAVGAALVCVALARGERLGWAVRGVVLAAFGLAGAWLASRGSLGADPPTIEVFLAPAALGLSLAVAAGGAEFDHAVRGAQLTWRQPAAFAAGLAVLLAAVPSLGAHLDGRFGLPATDVVRALRFLPPAPDGATERVLWVGRPERLAGGGWPLAGGLAYAVSEGTGPALAQRWYLPPNVAEQDLASALLLAADGQTDRLGHLLGPAGVRFVIVQTERVPVTPAAADGLVAPEVIDLGVAPETVRQPATLLLALAGQLDLRLSPEIEGSLVVYENTAWIPVRAQLRSAAASASRQLGAASLVQADLEGSTAVLPDVSGRVDQARGPVEVGTLYVAQPLDERWQLRTDAGTVNAEPAFGWASSYQVRAAGIAELRYRTSPLRWLALAVQAAAWLLLAALALPRRGAAVVSADVDDVLTPGRPWRPGGAPTGWDDDDLEARPAPVTAGSAASAATVAATAGAADDDGLRWGDEDPTWAEDEP